MPIRRVALEDLERSVETIEKTGRLTALTMAGDGAVIVAYEKVRKVGARETRG